MTDSRMRLAVYGSLAPGKANHDQLAGLEGRWTAGKVCGHLDDRGWAAGMGFPALRLDPSGPEVAVQLFESPDLPDHWQRLDAFEGDGYRRADVIVETEEGPVSAQIYEAFG